MRSRIWEDLGRITCFLDDLRETKRESRLWGAHQSETRFEGRVLLAGSLCEIVSRSLPGPNLESSSIAVCSILTDRYRSTKKQ